MSDSAPAAQRILAIIVARIGDTLLVTPALRTLGQLAAGGSLTVLAHPKRVDLLQHLPYIDRLGRITKNTAAWRGWLDSRRYDAAVVWGHDAGLVRYALRVARKAYAFDHDALPKDSRLVRVPPPTVPMHAVRERMLLAEAAGAKAGCLSLDFSLTPVERKTARRWLATRVAGTPLIGLQPVSFPTKAHRDWPMENFVELSKRLAASCPNAHFIVLGDKAACSAASSLVDALGKRVTIAAGKFGLRLSAALIAELDLYIGVDTGPTHVAGALGVPMVALYHHEYPGRNLMPLKHPCLQAIEHPMTGCPVTGRESSTDLSMAAIPVDSVFLAASELLARQGKEP